MQFTRNTTFFPHFGNLLELHKLCLAISSYAFGRLFCLENSYADCACLTKISAKDCYRYVPAVKSQKRGNNMRISDIILCEKQFTQPDGRVVCSGILSLIKVDFIPTNYSFSSVIGIASCEPDERINISVLLCDPDGKRVDGVDNMEITMPSDWSYETGALFASIDWNNARIMCEGDYSLRITSGSEEVGSKIIKVRKNDVS